MTTPAQPGLARLSKSFEPANIEAHWGPLWEKAGLGRAGFRGTGAPSAEAAAQGENFSIPGAPRPTTSYSPGRPGWARPPWP